MSEILSSALKVSGYGMLGIFAFMVIFYLVIIILIRIFPYKEEEKIN